MKASSPTLAPKVNGRKTKTQPTIGVSKKNSNISEAPFNLKELLRVLTAVNNEDFSVTLPCDEVGLNGKICDTTNMMIANLSRNQIKNRNQDWLKSNLANFAVMLQDQKDLKTIARKILSELASIVNAHYGALYISQMNEATQKVTLKLYSVYARAGDSKVQDEFSEGEGLVGQCAFEKKQIVITHVPNEYIKINSGLGNAKPNDLVLFPILFEKKVKAVIELASLDSFSEIHLEFMNQMATITDVALHNTEEFTRKNELLAQAQSLTRELKIQQEVLRITHQQLAAKASLLVTQNEEVEIKNKELAFQNEEKEKRATELITANYELAFQNREKEKRAAELSIANKEVVDSKKSLEEKAAQLALTSKYKSEFLANMSHELRSPLNSLLILAQQLYENEEGNLSDKQVRFAKTIYSCGDDLIKLINDILDLSKIESGIISVNSSTVRISEITSFVDHLYKPIAETRDIQFNIEIDRHLPASMHTDVLRLNQILKNLLSNAFKFTEKGEVTLKIELSERQWKLDHPLLFQAKKIISFSIRDTGIGIPPEKQRIIFEAFQQAEGSTSRKYGGTGLGLSISRGLIDLLGGAIELQSEVGTGSTFTLYLPLEMIPSEPTAEMLRKSDNVIAHEPLPADTREKLTPDPFITYQPVIEKIKNDHGKVIGEIIDETNDDKSNVKSDDKVLLVVEDDLRFGRIMIEKAHENGMKAIVATTYLEVFEFINRFNPIAITLDVNLPGTTGWQVIHMLRGDPVYCHIPTHVISGEENRVMALQLGARSFLLKPLENGMVNQLFTDILLFSQRKSNSLLIVEDNEIEASQIAKMLSCDKIDITIAGTSQHAIDLISKKDYDCIILDYMLPDMPGDDVLHEITKVKKIFTPVIVYSMRDFSSREVNNVIYNSNSHVTKGVNSLDVLLVEIISQLHINQKDIQPEKRKIIENVRSKKDILVGRTILVVDDDVRNLFAMTTVFERFNMRVTTAESGKEAITIVSEDPKIEMILMDIMMPEMDGYEAIQKIRDEQKNNILPIIAVTAKAMKSDRQKCIEAGASDYIVKPVKIDQLLSLMRLWFCKQ